MHRVWSVQQRQIMGSHIPDVPHTRHIILHNWDNNCPMTHPRNIAFALGFSLEHRNTLWGVSCASTYTVLFWLALLHQLLNRGQTWNGSGVQSLQSQARKGEGKERDAVNTSTPPISLNRHAFGMYWRGRKPTTLQETQ